MEHLDEGGGGGGGGGEMKRGRERLEYLRADGEVGQSCYPRMVQKWHQHSCTLDQTYNNISVRERNSF